ncbi:hypothetical protein [Enterococcus wangshanyuanii]|uniref:Uncharacterized protein n=1 Tax=Enterococcus wangshanyuanii TaxID=2005703 RepID=A0ABQ1PWN0_9ENTE|nr:hypothetical protein [Enterococcus wangshanyuanii]GGD05959.1 hypothetical protein GCM10011573_39200 [Enterococcus wangshanyuanii]
MLLITLLFFLLVFLFSFIGIILSIRNDKKKDNRSYFSYVYAAIVFLILIFIINVTINYKDIPTGPQINIAIQGEVTKL